MAVKTKEELMNSLKAIIGEDTSENSLAVLEDFQDTFSDFETRSGDDWKKKYEENDANWRKKYRDRFFNGGSDDEEFSPKNDREKYNFESLFDIK